MAHIENIHTNRRRENARERRNVEPWITVGIIATLALIAAGTFIIGIERVGFATDVREREYMASLAVTSGEHHLGSEYVNPAMLGAVVNLNSETVGRDFRFYGGTGIVTEYDPSLPEPGVNGSPALPDPNKHVVVFITADHVAEGIQNAPGEKRINTLTNPTGLMTVDEITCLPYVAPDGGKEDIAICGAQVQAGDTPTITPLSITRFNAPKDDVFKSASKLYMYGFAQNPDYYRKNEKTNGQDVIPTVMAAVDPHFGGSDTSDYQGELVVSNNPIAARMSGGPLFGEDGNVYGINHAFQYYYKHWIDSRVTPIPADFQAWYHAVLPGLIDAVNNASN